MTINSFAVKTQITLLVNEALTIIEKDSARIAADGRLDSIANRLAALEKQIRNERENIGFRHRLATQGLRRDQHFRFDASKQDKTEALAELERVVAWAYRAIAAALKKAAKKSPTDLEDKSAVELINDLIGEVENFVSDVQKAEQYLLRHLHAQQLKSQSALSQTQTLQAARLRQNFSYLKHQTDASAPSLLMLTVLILRLSSFLFKKT